MRSNAKSRFARAPRALMRLLPLVVSCLGAPAQPVREVGPLLAETFKIGLLTSLTGSATTSGSEFLRGARLAVDEINRQGGVLVRDRGGRMLIEMIVADDQTSIDGGVAAATRLVTQNKVDVVTGGFSSAVTLSSQVVIAQGKVPFLIAGASTPRVTRRTDIDTSWMFHYLEIGPYQGKSMAAFLAEVVRPALAPKGNLRVALIYQNTAFGEDFRLGLPGLGIVGWAESQGLPLEFVAQEKFELGETEFSRQLAVVKAANPQVILPIAFESETLDIIRQGVGKFGITALWGPASVAVESPTYYANIGEPGRFSTVAGYFSSYATPTGQAGAKLSQFRSDYQNFSGTPPGVFGATQYDCIYILKQAIEDAGSLDKTKIRRALETLDMPAQTLPVEGGRLRFDSNHEARFNIFVEQLFLDTSQNEMRPRIVWPRSLANADFVANTTETADLVLTAVPVADRVTQGGPAFFGFGITNRGPNPATNVVLTMDIPAWTTFRGVVSVADCTGPPAGETGTVTCYVGTLEPNKPNLAAYSVLGVRVSDSKTLQNLLRWLHWGPGVTIRATAATTTSTRELNVGNNVGAAKVFIVQK